VGNSCLNVKDMENAEKVEGDADLQKKASRTQLILYILMFLFMVLPFLVAWITGALRL
jgi:Co/Zn/Cd efflux system component